MSIVLWIENLWKATFTYVRGDLYLYACIIAYTVITIIALYALGSREMLSHQLYYAQWTTLFAFVLPLIALLVNAISVMHRFDSRRSLAFKRVYSIDRIAYLLSGIALLMGLMFFQGSFTSIKNVLPVLHHGFPHDVVQANIDSWLHFDSDPWKILHIAGIQWALPMVEWNYNVLWFVICFGSLFHVVISPHRRNIRNRYVVMFMLTWVVCGNVLAGIFLSAGPAFYGAVTGDAARFAGLTNTLMSYGSENSSAASFQAYLWSLHEAQRPGFGSGISAFPSVHVALIMMNALFLHEASRKYGGLGFIYVGVILVSSVYLGWHYAIDGYVSILVVSGLHYLCKQFLIKRPSSRQALRLSASGIG